MWRRGGRRDSPVGASCYDSGWSCRCRMVKHILNTRITSAIRLFKPILHHDPRSPSVDSDECCPGPSRCVRWFYLPRPVHPMTDPRWQCLECGGMAYPTSELCPFCGAKRPTAAEIVWHRTNRRVDDALARGERPSFPPGPPVTIPANGPIEPSGKVPWSTHGFLPPVDWKARHAAIKAERDGK